MTSSYCSRKTSSSSSKRRDVNNSDGLSGSLPQVSKLRFSTSVACTASINSTVPSITVLMPTSFSAPNTE